jgi:tetratricopeptide (TPR) repeat protein
MAFDPRSRPGNPAEIDRLARVVAKDPNSKAFMPLAEEYGKAGMWPEAVAVLEDGLKRYPGFVTAMVALGRAYDQMNQPVKAKAILEEAVKASPENLRAHRTLAKIYAAQGAIEAARHACTIILSANPQDQEATALRATLDAAAASVNSTLSSLREEPPAADTEPSAHVSAADVSAEVTAGADGLPENGHGDFPLESQATRVNSSHAIVNRLEGWLASIRTRRLDRKGSQDSERPTS